MIWTFKLNLEFRQLYICGNNNNQQLYQVDKEIALWFQTINPCIWNSRLDASSPDQAFINYNFSYARFRVRETVLGACPCTWEIVHVKEQMCTLLIITWYGGRNCTKLVLKPLVTKNGLFQSCVLLLPVDYTVSLYVVTTLHSCTLRNVFKEERHHFW